MFRGFQGLQGFWLGCGLLLFAVLIFGFRGQTALTAVASIRGNAGQSPVAQDQDEILYTDIVSERLQWIRDARGGGRDPFHEIRQKRKKATAALPKKTKQVSQPRLKAILYEQTAPRAILRLDGKDSAWLSEGDRFAGWSVVKIHRESVRVSRGSKSIELTQ
ncbi:MAG: hypothetical protein QF492_01340 [Candidatus Krumholzibacteria bacterium]|jgi:hypothetical protein|nr:hypothetical protein [Candidatus Krumholzibacteria bacterium]MDP6668536.1 hypothetical protein [Candidatus Krumholzibacteria bacterium]MDP6797790.1 hypothetical protein [Candidatus Krumholzibacteria bacterium]MDP7021417.1 hypothetical protein [Candidatus Krumholzibacteria bacterium]